MKKIMLLVILSIIFIGCNEELESINNETPTYYYEAYLITLKQRDEFHNQIVKEYNVGNWYDGTYKQKKEYRNILKSFNGYIVEADIDQTEEQIKEAMYRIGFGERSYSAAEESLHETGNLIVFCDYTPAIWDNIKWMYIEKR